MNICGNKLIRNRDYFVSVEDDRTGDREVVVARTLESLRKKVSKLGDARFDGAQVYRQIGTGADSFTEKLGNL